MADPCVHGCSSPQFVHLDCAVHNSALTFSSRPKPAPDVADEMTRLWTMIDGQQEQINAIEAKLVQLLAHVHSHPPEALQPALYGPLGGTHYTHDEYGRRLPEPVPRERHETGNGDR